MRTSNKNKNKNIANFLNSILHVDPIASLVIVSEELSSDEQEALRFLLQHGCARSLMPGIYALADLDEENWLGGNGNCTVPTPAPHVVAAAICQKRGWAMAIPRSVAEYLLGINELPTLDTLGPIPYDQTKPLKINKAGVFFEPGRAELFDALTPVGQALIQAVPRDISVEGLRGIGETAARGVMSAAFLLNMLRTEHSAGKLGERERTVAEHILGLAPLHTGKALRHAPLNFVPPRMAPVVEGWRIGIRGRVECLIADTVLGHPHIADGGRHICTSPLIWLDERLGWARTESRWYRLGGRMKRS